MGNQKGKILIIDNNKFRQDKTVNAINGYKQLGWIALGREKISEHCPEDRSIEYCEKPNDEECDILEGEEFDAQIVFLHVGNPCRRSFIEKRNEIIFFLITGDGDGVNSYDYGINCVGYSSSWNPESYSSKSWKVFLEIIGDPSEWKGKNLEERKNIIAKASQVFGIDITISKIIHELNLRTLSYKIDKTHNTELCFDNYKPLKESRISEMFPDKGIAFYDFIRTILTEEIPSENYNLTQVIKLLSDSIVVKWNDIELNNDSADEQLKKLDKIIENKNLNEFSEWIDFFDRFLRNLRAALQQ